MGRPGRKPLYAKREAFARLIAEGIPSGGVPDGRGLSAHRDALAQRAPRRLRIPVDFAT
jgi:hypothetical protein